MEISTRDVFGAPCWVSLMARDLEGAQRFYGAVLGWEFRKGGLGEEFSVGLLDRMPVAGIGALATSMSMPVAWSPYFAVDDADQAVARIRERAGTVAVGPVSLAGRGRAALAADLEGATFGIWEGPVRSEWRVGAGPAPAWLELRTRNAFDAAIFYGGVLEWATERAGGCQVSYEEDKVVLRQGGEPVARLSTQTAEGGEGGDGEPQVRAHWHVHFRVPDLDRAVEAAVAHGGRTTSAVKTTATERSVTLLDPDGGLFDVTENLGAEARSMSS
ncbi:VOC family protein [Streptomyces sp. NPDC090022]|uniref:VOC family protein n=1 Tax=Streptomyces sp. NPDC090022 TaxID=3365920 RepID=UPI003817A95C